jgi:hypothetical protein
MAQQLAARPEILQKVQQRVLDPYSAAEQLLAGVLQTS